MQCYILWEVLLHSARLCGLPCGYVQVQELELVVELPAVEPYDWVLCLDVSEHIPPEDTRTFLGNLRTLARRGLVAEGIVF